jgi:glycerol-3-phosphate acyltransferase PlsX
MPELLRLAESYDPDVTGGAALLGVKGMTVISHGASSAREIVNAVAVAAECARRDVIDRMREAVAHAG